MTLYGQGNQPLLRLWFWLDDNDFCHSAAKTAALTHAFTFRSCTYLPLR